MEIRDLKYTIIKSKKKPNKTLTKWSQKVEWR